MPNPSEPIIAPDCIIVFSPISTSCSMTTLFAILTLSLIITSPDIEQLFPIATFFPILDLLDI